MKATFRFWDRQSNFKEEKIEAANREELSRKIEKIREKLKKEWGDTVRFRKIDFDTETILKVKIKKEYVLEWKELINRLGYYYEETSYCWVVAGDEKDDFSEIRNSPYVLSVENMPMVVLD